MKSMKKTITLLLVVLTVLASLSLYSCGGKTPGAKDPAQTAGTNTRPNVTEDETQNADYAMPTPEQYDGRRFRILNAEPWFDLMCTLTADADSPDDIEQKMYERNIRIEDELGIFIDQARINIHSLKGDAVMKAMSNDDLYDIVMQKGEEMGSLITSGYLTNLAEIKSMNLGWDHWRQEVINAATIGKDERIYFAAGDATLMPYELAMMVAFNKEILLAHDIEFPYEQVKNGTWTVEEMKTIIEETKSLNGDESWSWSVTGNCVYGLSSFGPAASAFRMGANLNYCVKNPNNGEVIYLAAADEHFASGISKLQSLFEADGNFIWANNADNGCQFGAIFSAGRATMMISELNALRKRSIEADFGILPMPMLDSEQKTYYTNITTYALFITIPSLCGDPEFAGAVMDLMCYWSADVWDKYIEDKISYQGVPDMDSWEMMQYVREGLVLDYSVCYGWTTDLDYEMRTVILRAEGSPSTKLESFQNPVQTAITKMLGSVNG